MIDNIKKFMEGSLRDTLWYFRVGWILIEIRHTHFPQFENVKNIKTIEIWQNKKTGEMREVLKFNNR